MALRILILVTHLQGVGHLARAAAIGRALARAGRRGTLVSGGLPVRTIDTNGLDLVQLPPARIEGNDFRRLLDADGAPVSDAWRRRRRSELDAVLAAVRPDIVITE